MVPILTAPWITLEMAPPPLSRTGALPSWDQPSPLQFPIFTFTVCKSEKPFITLDLKKRYRSLDLISQAKQKQR